MTPQSQKRDWYNRLSGIYDRLADPSERPARLRGLRQLNPQPGERLLEIGFGTGQALLSLAHAVGPSGVVRGIDLSDGMKEVAIERLKNDGVDAWVQLNIGDARALPYDTGAFDGVFMSFTLELFSDEDIPKVLSEIRRVLKPSGRLCVISLTKPPQPGVSSRLYEKLHDWFPSYIDCRPIRLKEVLERAGFRVQEEEGFSLWGIPGEAVKAIL